ncbi:hypothetical protein JB92DRAFT_2911909 [Gautieria morchelliformis]|nr:hypothetical protein JB92DRAFT_2911909 [Gautieria morchelliformis]
MSSPRLAAVQMSPGCRPLLPTSTGEDSFDFGDDMPLDAEFYRELDAAEQAAMHDIHHTGKSSIIGLSDPGAATGADSEAIVVDPDSDDKENLAPTVPLSPVRHPPLPTSTGEDSFDFGDDMLMDEKFLELDAAERAAMNHIPHKSSIRLSDTGAATGADSEAIVVDPDSDKENLPPVAATVPLSPVRLPPSPTSTGGDSFYFGDDMLMDDEFFWQLDAAERAAMNDIHYTGQRAIRLSGPGAATGADSEVIVIDSASDDKVNLAPVAQ